MKAGELALYRDLLGDIKHRVRKAQHRATLSANAEMLRLYWDIGRLIVARQQAEGWGAGVIPRLAADLKNQLPGQKGFSQRNIGRMIAFFREYPNLPQPAAKIAPQAAARSQRSDAPAPDSHQPVPQPAANSPLPPNVLFGLPWFHHVVLIEKIKDLPTRHWYAHQAVEQGWSRATLTTQIRNHAHQRQGAAITNFTSTLPEAHADLAQGLLKDPYLFDFLTLEEPFHERELEAGLLRHLEQFLLELGRGFAFVGRQYHLDISDHDFYLDLLFYHLQLRCYIVIDLKRGDFKPEYAGKMNFYCSAIDDLLRHPHDAPTIGLILCQNKDRILAEYSLRDIHKPIGLADYELTRALPEDLASSLPSIETIEIELSQGFTPEEDA
jgi:predicted nuclease of restriction endonuclease-like (RecB) superfamily